MKLFLLLLFLCQIVISFQLKLKRVIIVLFPGGRKINNQLKELIDYCRLEQSIFTLEFHIVLYKTDEIDWKDEYSNLYSYGESSYLYNGTKDLDEYPQQPYFKFYQIRMRWFYQQFLESTVISDLEEKTKKIKISFDMIITDIPNYISVIIAKKFNIELSIIASMRPLPQLFHGGFDINSNYYPFIGSDFTDDMTFSQRCHNYFTQISNNLIEYIGRYEIRYLFSLYNYTINDADLYFNDPLIIIQYPPGLTFPLSSPPNFIFLNSILPDLQNKNITSTQFLLNKKRNKIIIVSKDAVDLMGNDLIESLNDYNEEIELHSIKDEEKNFLFELLSMDKTVGLITTGDINRISKSLYNMKPVIIIGNGWREQNVKSFVRKKNYGLGINEVSFDNVNIAIERITKLNSLYWKNAVKYGMILRGNKNAKNEFWRWVHHGFLHNYTTLIVPLYKKGSWFQIHCLDAFCLFCIAIICMIWIMYKLIKSCYLKWSKKKNIRKEKIE